MAVIAQTHTGPEKGGNYEFHWSGAYLEAHLISDVGKKRSRNEDSCAMCAPDDQRVVKDRGMLFAVADGMGGVSGGDFASRLSLQTIVQEYYARQETGIPARLMESVGQANRRIYQEAENHPEYYGMGTTVSLLLVDGDHAYIAQVGDSRVYLLRKGEPIWQVTDDHSLVAEQVRNGYISEEEARTHSLKNLITRAVGTKEAVNVDLFAIQVRQGDTLLICSDGLSNVVDNDQLTQAISGESLQGAARVLVGRALEAGAPDNVTAVLVRLTSAPPRTKLHEGANKVSPVRGGIFGALRRLIT
jgi:protein phosphatase